MTTILDTARSYVSSGISVIPIRLGGAKDPAWPELEPYFERRPTKEELQEMFSRNVGIGIIGGKISGNLEILDFDKPGVFESWMGDLAEHDPGLHLVAESLPRVSTPALGMHLYYRCNKISGPKKLARAKTKFTDCTGKEKDTIIETKGEGGYVLAPPSPPECHKANRGYEWIGGARLTEIPTITEGQRNKFFEFASAYNEVEELRPTEKKPTPIEGNGRPGDDFNTRGPSWSEILEGHGWTFAGERGECSRWRRPGKTEGLSATTGHCGDKLYVFSSNAAPFEPERTYDKFAAYCLLEHNGDFSVAARALVNQGYGKTETRKDFMPEPPPDETPHTVDTKPESKIELKILKMRDVLDIWDSSGDQEAIPTPIPCLNMALAGGWPIGQASTVLAYTGVGKSEFARQSAIHAAINGYGVIHVDIEMGYKRLAERTISQATGIPPIRLRDRKNMPKEERNLLDGVLEKLRPDERLRYFSPGIAPRLEDLSSLLTQEILSMKNGKPTLVIFDSVQRLAAGSHLDQKRLQVEEFMIFATALAQNSECAVMLVAEQKRKQEGGKPEPDDVMTSGAESRAVEYQSDVVISLIPEDQKITQLEAADAEEESERRIQILIAKNRNGSGTGYIKDSIVFSGPCWGMRVEQRKKQEIEDLVLEAAPFGKENGFSIKAICDKIHRRTIDVRQTCRNLVDLGKLQEKGNGAHRKFYRILAVPEAGRVTFSNAGTGSKKVDQENANLPYKD